MTKKIKLSDCRPFDIAEYLDDEAMITEYMNSVLEENDPAMLASALGDIARAHGMIQQKTDQHAFLARSLAARDHARETNSYISADQLMAELTLMLEQAQRTAKTNQESPPR